MGLFDAALQVLRRPSAEELLTLTVRLLFRGPSAVVEFELEKLSTTPESAPEGTAQPPTAGPAKMPAWTVPYAEFEQDRRPVVPAVLLDDLSYRLQQLAVHPAQPLWLRFVRPYGILCAVPWERNFVEMLGRPVLRLPDFPDRPLERPDNLISAFLVDPGPSAIQEDLVRRARLLASSVLKASRHATKEVNLFTTSRWHRVLGDALADMKEVRVHHPDGALEGPAGADKAFLHLSSAPWVSWISRVMEGRGLDALHFLGRGAVGDSGPYLQISGAPWTARDRKVPTVDLDVSEFDLLMGRSGAWSATFVPDTPECESGVFGFADTLARARPTAVLGHTLSESAAAELALAHSLLFGGSRKAVSLREGFLYCHPSFTGTDSMPSSHALAAVLASQGALIAPEVTTLARAWRAVSAVLPGVNPPRHDVPNWLGASQRYLESSTLEQLRLGSEDVLMSGRSLAEQVLKPKAAEDDTAKVLSEIQGVIADYVKKQSSQGGKP